MSDQNKSAFLLKNGTAKPLCLSFEPEGDTAQLSPGEEIVIHQTYKQFPTTVQVEALSDNKIALAIWPGDGSIQIEKNGSIVR